jgi:hypothetical protein
MPISVERPARLLRQYVFAAALSVLLGCAGWMHGYTLSRFQGQLIMVKAGGPGAERVSIEAAYDATVRQYVQANGPPDYIFVSDARKVEFYYVGNDRVVVFGRHDFSPESFASTSSRIPEAVSASFSADDRLRLAQQREAATPNVGSAGGAPGPVGSQEGASHDQEGDTLSAAHTILHSKPHGYDIEAVYDALDRRQKDAAKREFETTDEYQARLKILERSSASGFRIGQDIVAFEIPLNSPLHLGNKVTYDADAEMMRITIASDISARNDDLALESKVKFVQLGSYIGSNAFGAKVRVEKAMLYTYFVSVANPEAFSVSTSGGSIPRRALELQIPMDRATARVVKSRLQAMALCTLSEPFVSQSGDYHKATIDEPNETAYARRYLHCHLRDLVVYDPTTGKIFGHLSHGTLPSSS